MTSAGSRSSNHRDAASIGASLQYRVELSKDGHKCAPRGELLQLCDALGCTAIDSDQVPHLDSRYIR